MGFLVIDCGQLYIAKTYLCEFCPLIHKTWPPEDMTYGSNNHFEDLLL